MTGGVILGVVLAAAAAGGDSLEVRTPMSTNETSEVVIRTAPLRNPFWTIGHADGEYEAISDGSAAAESSLAVAAAEAAAAERAARRAGASVGDDAPTQERRWRRAARQVKVSGVTKVFAGGGQKAVIGINGRTYARGDRLAVDDDGCRFIWKVQDFDDVGYVKLTRIRYRSLQAAKPDENENL